jgi:hypothetical protein
MAEENYSREEIATRQLETAIDLFLRGKDRFPVISLAAAASNILGQPVKRKGREPFIDYTARVGAALSGKTPSRRELRQRINERLGISDLKHHSKDSKPTLDLDEEASALDAISMAVADFVAINGDQNPFIQRFLKWHYVTHDGPAQMKAHLEHRGRISRR